MRFFRHYCRRAAVMASRPAALRLICCRAAALFLDLFQRLPFGFRPNVHVAWEHLPRDVACNFHNGLFTSAILGELGDQRMPVIVPAAGDACLRADIVPGGLQRSDRPRWVLREAAALRMFGAVGLDDVPGKLMTRS
jgi:hypothetical protein